MRIIFMGTPDFSVPALNALHDAGHEICAVYSQPPRPAGRGKKLRPSPVQSRAEALGLQIRHPVSLKSLQAQAEFAELKADIAVVVAYGLILPKAILDAPTHGCLNIHASLLPRWRGAAPIHRAIMAGDERTGICIMQMDVGLDTGPVLMREEIEIGPEETTGLLHDRLAALGGQAITRSLAQFDDLEPIPQLEEGVSYAHKIDKSEAQIDWSRSATQIDRQIRGLSPYPGAWFEYDSTRIKVLGARIYDRAKSHDVSPGTTLDDQLTVACAQGAIELTHLQRAGKSAQSRADFLRGTKIPAGTQL